MYFSFPPEMCSLGIVEVVIPSQFEMITIKCMCRETVYRGNGIYELIFISEIVPGRVFYIDHEYYLIYDDNAETRKRIGVHQVKRWKGIVTQIQIPREYEEELVINCLYVESQFQNETGIYEIGVLTDLVDGRILEVDGKWYLVKGKGKRERDRHPIRVFFIREDQDFLSIEDLSMYGKKLPKEMLLLPCFNESGASK